MYAPQTAHRSSHHSHVKEIMHGNRSSHHSPQRYSNSHVQTVQTSSHSRSPNRRPGHTSRHHHHDHSYRFRNHLIACAAEFVGTLLFLWFAFAWQMTATSLAIVVPGSPVPSAETVIYISIGYGFSLLVAAWSFYRISGGLFNPAVTLGMVLSGSLPAIRGAFLLPAQILGGIAAAGLVKVMFPFSAAVLNTTLAPGVSLAQGVFIEMFLTILLLFSILMLAAEKSKFTFMAPLGIGLALFVAELAGVATTGGSVNPARTFGPAVVTGVWVGYQWLYWVGPFLGSLVAAGLYRLVKHVDYEWVNPRQDSAAGEFAA